MAIQAAVYKRQSSARANKSEVSTATQHQKGTECAEALIRTLPMDAQAGSGIDYYEDLGISAYSGAGRPAFERMINDCMAGRKNYIIVYYISRFSRMEPLDAIPIVTELLNRGVTIVSVTEGTFRRDSLMDLIHLIMRLHAAHEESKNKSIAVRDAKGTARALGGYVGGKPPYGFRFKKEIRLSAEGRPIAVTLLDVDPKEATVIQGAWATIKRHMGAVYVPGAGDHQPGSLTGICADFEMSGVPTRGATVGKERADSAWDARTLIRILRDPRLAGFAAEPVYRVREDGRKSSQVMSLRIMRDENGVPVAAHPAILPPVEWWALQTWLDTRGRGKGLYRGQALLSAMDVLFCECGAVHTSAKRTGSGDNYRCRRPRGRRMPGQHEGDCTIGQKGLDQYVAGAIVARIRTADSDPESADMLAEAARRYGAANEPADIAAERGALLEERASLNSELDGLYKTQAEGGYQSARGRQEFVSLERALDLRIAAADARLTELDTLSTPALPLGEWLSEDPGADPIGEGSWWHFAPMDERRAFVKLFVTRITVRKAWCHAGKGVPVADRVDITFATAPDVSDDETFQNE